MEREKGLFADWQHDMAVQNHVADHGQIILHGHGADETVEITQEPVSFGKEFQKRLATGQAEDIAERRFVSIEREAEQGGFHLAYFIFLSFKLFGMGRRMRDDAAQIVGELAERLVFQHLAR